MNWKVFILVVLGYTFLYAGISKYSPYWTDGKPQSLLEASGLTNYFRPPPGTPPTKQAQLKGVTIGQGGVLE